MLGLIASVILLICKVDRETVLLVFIGFQLFTLAEIERIRFARDNKARRMLSQAVVKMSEGFKEGFHGERNETDRNRDQDGDGE